MKIDPSRMANVNMPTRGIGTTTGGSSSGNVLSPKIQELIGKVYPGITKASEIINKGVSEQDLGFLLAQIRMMEKLESSLSSIAKYGRSSAQSTRAAGELGTLQTFLDPMRGRVLSAQQQIKATNLARQAARDAERDLIQRAMASTEAKSVESLFGRFQKGLVGGILGNKATQVSEAVGMGYDLMSGIRRLAASHTGKDPDVVATRKVLESYLPRIEKDLNRYAGPITAATVKSIQIQQRRQDAMAAQAEAILNAPAVMPGGAGGGGGGRRGGGLGGFGRGRFGRIFRNMGVVGGAMMGGAMGAGGFIPPVGPPVMAGMELIYDLARLGIDVHKWATEAMTPAAMDMERMSRAGNIAGIKYSDLIGLRGGSAMQPGRMNDFLARLGVTQAGFADITSAYGMPFRPGAGVGLSALAQNSKFLSFMSAPEWADFQKNMLGMGFGGGASGLEGMFNMLSASIGRAIKGNIPPSQTFDSIKRSLAVLSSTGQVMPYSRAVTLATMGITSSNPSLRQGIAQAGAMGAWGAMLNNLPNNPMAFTSVLAAVHGASGSSVLNSANVLKTLKHFGLSTAPLGNKNVRHLLDMAGARNPVLASMLLGSLGVSGELVPLSMRESMSKGFQDLGMSKKDARDFAALYTASLMPAGPARTGTLNRFGFRAAATTDTTRERKGFVDLTGVTTGATMKIGGREVPVTMPAGLVPFNLPTPEATFRTATAAATSAKLDASNIALVDFASNLEAVNKYLRDLVGTLSDWTLFGGIGGPGGFGPVGTKPSLLTGPGSLSPSSSPSHFGASAAGGPAIVPLGSPVPYSGLSAPSVGP